MWGSVETTVKLGLTGVTGFAIACVVIETAGAVIGGGLTGGGDGYAYVCTRTLVEFLLALYVADFVTGLIHMLLDFQTVNNDALRLHVETIGEAHEVAEDRERAVHEDVHEAREERPADRAALVVRQGHLLEIVLVLVLEARRRDGLLVRVVGDDVVRGARSSCPRRRA